MMSVFIGIVMGPFALESIHDLALAMNCHKQCTRMGSLFMTTYILVNQSMEIGYY